MILPICPSHDIVDIDKIAIAAPVPIQPFV
jgi:hypothetical protein